MTVIPADLSLPGAARKLFDEVEKQKIQIDVLVNNAGIGAFGFFTEIPWEKQAEMIHLNVVALTQLCHLFLPGMIQRKNGGVINVASTAAFQPGPLMAVYYASKSFVLHFSEAIANETNGTGVKVVALCPGPTESQFQAAAQMKTSRLVRGRRLPTAVEVAEYAFLALKKGKVVAIPGFLNQVFVWLVRWMPRFLVRTLIRKYQELR